MSAIPCATSSIEKGLSDALAPYVHGSTPAIKHRQALRAYQPDFQIGQKLVAAGVGQDQVGAEIQKLVVAKAKELGVTVNPRYGKWDAETGDVVAVDSASSAVTPSGN